MGINGFATDNSLSVPQVNHLGRVSGADAPFIPTWAYCMITTGSIILKKKTSMTFWHIKIGPKTESLHSEHLHMHSQWIS